MNRKKADIILQCKGYFRVVVFLLILFTAMLISFIYQYIINRNHIGFAFFLLVIFMAVFGGAAVFIYSQLGSKLLIYGSTLVTRKWYGVKKTFDIKDIQEVIFEKSNGEIVSVRMRMDERSEKFWNNNNNFDMLYQYLIDNIEKNRVKCYILGTQKETALPK